jgi:hypothetical protein
MVEDLIQQFVEGLIKEAGLEKMPESFKKEYNEKLGLEAQKRIGAVALKELSAEAMDKFGELIEKDPSPKKLEEFFKQNIPDYETKVQNALQEFANEFIESAKQLKASIGK